MASIKIQLLGGFVVDHDGHQMPPIPSSLGRSLFAFLVTYRDRRHTRDLLAGTFWPDLPEQVARRRLSQALWQIQSVLQEAENGEQFIQSSASDVSFVTTDYWLDVVEFDRHIATAALQSATHDPSEVTSLEQAVQLYRGEFLAGFYDDWIDFEQERLRSDYLRALERLTALHKGRADYEAALHYARRVCLYDPLRESAHREAMRLCFLLGRSNEALQQYDRCAEVLLEELDRRPSANTEELRIHISQMRDKNETPFAPTIQSPLLSGAKRIPLVGRSGERESVLRRMEDTLLGRGGVFFIEGESGIGKTRLLEELIEDAQWRGLNPLVAECSEAELLHPLGGLNRALESGITRLRFDQLRAVLHPMALADLGQAVTQVGSWLTETRLKDETPFDTTPEHRSQTIRSVLLALADLNPMVLLIDDAQWLDKDSAGVLSDLAPDLEHRGLLLGLSYRATEARDRKALWEHIVNIDTRVNTLKLKISPLDLVESAVFVEESLGVTKVDSDFAEGLYHETGGNPFFILESLRAWHQAEMEDLERGLPSSPRHPHPPSSGITSLITRRLDALTPETREVLEAAAALGTSAEPELLSAVAERSTAATLKSVAHLVDRGLLRENASGYEHPHDQIRRVVLDGLDEDRLTAIHERAGCAIEKNRPDRVEQLAYHYNAARNPRKAFTHSLAAGKKAVTVGAFETAVGHFENAARWAVEEGRYQVLTEWDDALHLLGRRSEQQRILDQLAGLAADQSEKADLARRRSRLLTEEGNHRQAIQMALRAVENADATLAPGSNGKMLQNLGLTLARAGRAGDAIPHLEAAVEAFAGEVASKAGALCDLGNVLCETQSYKAAEKALDEALAYYRTIDDLRGIAETNGQLAIVSMELGDGDTAVELYEAALETCRKIDYRRGVAVNLANLANARNSQANVGKALSHYSEAAMVFSEIGDRMGAALVRANAASVRYAVLGDESVEADVESSLAFLESVDHRWGQAFCHEHLAALHLGRGDLAVARNLVNRGLDLLKEGHHRWVEVHLRRLAAEIELDDGRPIQAGKQIELAGRLCKELGFADVVPTVESLASVVALERGDTDEALRRARKATELLQTGTELPQLVWYRHHLAAKAAGEGTEAEVALAHSCDRLDQVLDSLEHNDRKLATRAPQAKRILRARDRTFPRSEQIPLPRVSVPLGRALAKDDWITVGWTVSDPSDFRTPNLVDRRHRQLRRLLHEASEQGADPRVQDLAMALDVSVSTVRRDLAWFRRSGDRVVTRGSR